MAPTLSGCLDPPPEYTVPDPVPPVLIVDQIVPKTTTIVQTNFPTVSFIVPFRADDAGQALYALFVPDMPAGPISTSKAHGGPVVADPRPFAEQTGRSVTFPDPGWTWQADQVSPGCHTMTMILSRLNNLDFTTKIGVVTIKDDLATAQITWLLALGPSAKCGTWPDPGAGSSP
jgi:hypothetical protein